MPRMYALKLRGMRGVAAIELAILMIPLMMLAFGVVEYGRALYHYNALAKAVRDGVRLLAQNDPLHPTYGTKMTEARCLAVHGNTNCSGPPLAPGLTTDHVVICDHAHPDDCSGVYVVTTTGMGTIHLVEMKIVGYEFSYLGLPFLPLGDSTTFGDGLANPGIRAVMRQTA